MKKVLFISLLIVLSFSCQKEKLKDEKEIFIGEWELQFAVKANLRYDSAHYTTIYPSSCGTTLSFEKSGAVSFSHEGKEEKYKMNFKSKNEATFRKNMVHEVFANKDSGQMFLGEHYLFTASFHEGFGEKNRTLVSGSIGTKWMMIKSSSKIITYNNSDAPQYYYKNYFKKVD